MSIFFFIFQTTYVFSFYWQCVRVGNVYPDLPLLSYGCITIRRYGRYDVNGFRFRSARFEDARPLAATCNSGVVVRVDEPQGQRTNYYGIIKDIFEISFA
jgi:hypothetical protein